MRFINCITFLIFLTLYACQAPPTEERGGEAGMEVIAVSNRQSGSNGASEAKNSTMMLENTPSQGAMPNTANFAGSYVLPASAGYSFSVNLIQKGDSLVGSYCGYTETRSDCGLASQGAPDCKIQGLIRNNKAYLVFMSCYMAKTGQAQLTVKGQDIIWKTTLFPPNEDGFGFCAAPDSAVLRNENKEFALPVLLPTLEVKCPGLLLDLPTQETYLIFGKSKVRQSLDDHDAVKTYLPSGTPFRILKKEGEYVYTNIGDETFDVPRYKIEYIQYGRVDSGYIDHDDIALNHFKDDRGNMFMLGLNGEEDLSIMVRNHTENWQAVSTGVRDLIKNENAHFPLFRYHLKTLPELTLGETTFLTCELSHNDAGRTLSYGQLFQWDGKRLSPVMPFVEHVLPYDLHPWIESGANRLHLDFKTYKWAYQKPVYTEARQSISYVMKNNKLSYVSENPMQLDLGYFGEQNEFTFPDTLETLSWLGVRTVDSLIKLEPIILTIKKSDDENEMNGKWVNKMIQPENGTQYDFMISGLPSLNDSVMLASATFSKGEFKQRKEKLIHMGDTDWRFTALGNADEHNGSVEFTLLLTGTKNGNLIEQALHFSPFREMPVAFHWAGDLDSDGYPDFIINLSEKGMTTDTRLFLSGSSEPGKLVREAGSFYRDGLGC